MTNILEDLYNGNINPSERPYPQSHEEKQCNKKFVELEEDFLNSLNENEKLLYKRISYELGNSHLYTEEKTFVMGFRLGAQIMLDVLADMPQ